MKLKVYKIFVLSLFFCFCSYSQNKISGIIYEKGTELKLEDVSVYDTEKGLITKSNSFGYYEFITIKKNINLVFIVEGYQFVEKSLLVEKNINLDVTFSNQIQELSEVIVKANNQKIFQLSRLKDIEGTSIFAGKNLR